MCASTQEEEWLVGNGKREIAPQQEMPGTKWEMGNGKLDVDLWNKQSGKVRSSPKWTGFTRFCETVICTGMHAFLGNQKGSRSAPAIQFLVQPKSLLSGARLRSALRMHCVRSATSLLYRGAHAYKTRPESGHRFTPRLELHVHSAPLSK